MPGIPSQLIQCLVLHYGKQICPECTGYGDPFSLYIDIGKAVLYNIKSGLFIPQHFHAEAHSLPVMPEDQHVIGLS